ncbi:PQQ-binding-like beta-propeller repeat protein [Rhodococcus sp. MALMAid1271]|uniref:outer membrane protein assembly factor BamB family protein n=1 Tax=Rhodococcus sp. MALMAid1271 TaxID=3411744 RepID=UPI003BA3401B
MARRHRVSAAAAVLATALACVACTGDKPPPPAGTPIDGATGAAPGMAWTLTPADAGVPGGQFRDPTAGADTDSMESGSITDGSTVVTLVGHLDGRDYDDAALVGFDIADGAVRWRVPAEDILGCGAQFVDGRLVCYRGVGGSGSAILTVDGRSGQSRTYDAGFPIIELTTADNHVYTSHTAGDSGRTTVSRGTADDLDADWSVPFESANSQSASTLRTDNGIGLVEQARHVYAFDLDTGDSLWSRTAPDCARSAAASRSGAVRLVRTDCSDPSAVTGSEIVDTDGNVLAATDSATIQRPTFDSPAESSPLLLGTGGYRPAEPDPVWTNDALVWALPPDISDSATRFLATNGLAYAVVGSVALLRDDDAATESAIDLDTGELLWSRDSGRSAQVGALDGSVATLFGPEVLEGVDVATGNIVWDIPTTAFDDEGIDAQSRPMLDRVGTDSIYTRALSISVLRDISVPEAG